MFDFSIYCLTIVCTCYSILFCLSCILEMQEDNEGTASLLDLSLKDEKPTMLCALGTAKSAQSTRNKKYKASGKLYQYLFNV